MRLMDPSPSFSSVVSVLQIVVCYHNQECLHIDSYTVETQNVSVTNSVSCAAMHGPIHSLNPTQLLNS